MEFTYQSTMQLPASYAVLSEDEMVYTVGGAFELNINAQDVLNFTVNVGVNLVRMLGQAAISNTIAGIIDMRNDGLTTMGAIERLLGPPDSRGQDHDCGCCRFCRRLCLLLG